MSLWDYAKEPVEEEFKGRTLMSYFTDLPRGTVRLGAAGKIANAQQAAAVLDAGCDFVLIRRGAILHHDFPLRLQRDQNYIPPALPVTRQHLAEEGLGAAFIGYLNGWPGFVAAEETQPGV